MNIIGTNALLQLAKRRGAKLLYISSSEVYGAKEDSLPFSESKYGYIDVLNPRNCYANAKRAAENLCISYGVEYGVNSDIVRPGHIYGPSSTDSDSRAAAQFMRNAVHGDDIVLKSSGTQLRSYCYTLDCASAILSVLINGESLNAYNISNKDSIVNIRNVAEKFAELGGVKLVFQAPSDAEAKGYSLMANSSLDSRKLEGLGWRAQFDLETGVRNCIKSFAGSLLPANKLTDFCAEFSLSLYLIHWPVLKAFRHFYPELNDLYRQKFVFLFCALAAALAYTYVMRGVFKMLPTVKQKIKSIMLEQA